MNDDDQKRYKSYRKTRESVIMQESKKKAGYMKREQRIQVINEQQNQRANMFKSTQTPFYHPRQAARGESSAAPGKLFGGLPSRGDKYDGNKLSFKMI